MERICTKCGNPIEDGDSFCDACGAKYEAEDDNTAVRKTPEKKTSAGKKPSAEKKDLKKQTDANQALKGFVGDNKKMLIGLAVAVVLILAAVLVIRGMAANTPEGVLRTAVSCRVNGDVKGGAAVDYDCNFSLSDSKNSAIARREANAELTKVPNTNYSLRIKTEVRVVDDEKTQKTDLTARKEALKASYRDTDDITDIRQFTYDLMHDKEVRYSGTAEAIKVGGKWYIRGVAEAAFNL